MTAQYIDHGTHLTRLADGAVLPKDVGNRDYAAVFEQLAANPSLVSTPDTAIGLSALKSRALIEIDTAAERARLRYITPGAGQAQTYQMKLEQAQAYQSAGSPADASPWPFIAAESAALAVTPAEAAALIIATRDAWVTVGAAIEQARMGGKRAVTQSASIESVNNARAAALNTLEHI